MRLTKARADYRAVATKNPAGTTLALSGIARAGSQEALMIAIKNILVATDFGEPADAALRYGRELAGRFGCTLHVLNVIENFYVTTLGAETYAAFVPEMQRELEN